MEAPAINRMNEDERGNPSAQNLLKQYKKAHGDQFAITRLHYQTTGNGWWVRVGWKNKLPIYQETVLDQDYDGEDQSKAAAMVLRDEAFLELADLGLIGRPRQSLPHLTRLNKTGIPGMTLQKTQSRTGAGYLLAWKVNWSDHGRPIGRTFAFSSYDNDGFKAFVAAATCRMESDLRIYGFSEIDPEEENLHNLYKQAMKNYGIGI